MLPSVNSSEVSSSIVGVLETQKCLNNFLLNCPSARVLIAEAGATAGIMKRLIYKDETNTLLPQVKFFDLRILFLITAFCSNIR